MSDWEVEHMKAMDKKIQALRDEVERLRKNNILLEQIAAAQPKRGEESALRTEVARLTSENALLREPFDGVYLHGDVLVEVRVIAHWYCQDACGDSDTANKHTPTCNTIQHVIGFTEAEAEMVAAKALSLDAPLKPLSSLFPDYAGCDETCDHPNGICKCGACKDKHWIFDPDDGKVHGCPSCTAKPTCGCESILAAWRKDGKDEL